MLLNKELRHNSTALLLLTLAFASGIRGVGFRYYAAETRALEFGVREKLSAIAGTKVHQISEWRRERIADARVALSNDIMMSALRRAMTPSCDRQTKQQLLRWMATFQ